MTEYKWMKTDTASIMFSCLSSKKWGRTFRMAAVFKDHDTSWPKECVRVLSSQGLEIRVESTHGNGGN